MDGSPGGLVKPYRNRKYLNEVAGLQQCALCGKRDGTIVPAHFSGKYSSSLGKGMGQKAADHCVAALCHTCHGDMDGYVMGNDDERAARFMVAILKTQHALLREGVSIEASRED